jgi:hypothetical protein
MMNRIASPDLSVVRLYYHDERREARSTRLCLPIVAATIVAMVSVTQVDARRPEGRAFCRDRGVAAGAESTLEHQELRPRDDGFQRPDFATFRRQLQEAVALKDEEAVLRVVDSAVRVDFGGGGGLDAFHRLMNTATENFWGELSRVLELGGRFRTPDAFDAPYVYSDWPEGFDALECAAVVGRGVRLRATPGTNARTLTTVDFAIVKLFPREVPGARGWRRVGLATGRTGYIASRYVRSPIDYRALFEHKQGRWWLVAFVAGD